MYKIPKILFPTVVGLSVFFIVSKLFPEKVSDISNLNSQKDLRGGDLVEVKNISKYRKIFKGIVSERALKISFFSLFLAGGSAYFEDEIKTILTTDFFINIFKEICDKQVDGKLVDGNLKVVCDMIKEHDLNSHSQSFRKIIVNMDLSNENKINLLKIKLDYIINGNCYGKRRFLIMITLAAILTFCTSGLAGLLLFLEALYRLFKEGRISRALYKEILKRLGREADEELLEEIFSEI